MPSAEELAGVATVPSGVGTSALSATGSGEMPQSLPLLEATAGLLAGAEGSPDGDLAAGGRGAGMFMGEGLPPVPARLVDRIRRWEYIEMYELLPELLADHKGEGASCKLSRARGRKQVQEIAVWLQCFAVFVGVVANYEPEVVPGLMAYMVSIIRASQEYEGAAWVAYDAAYRRQAAATGSKKWGGVNTSLYTICFTGKARRSARCDHCLSTGHKTGECFVLGEEDGEVSNRMRAVESAVLALSHVGPSRGGGRSDLCRLYNERRCTFRNCKYRHACKWCGGAHPGGDCQAATRRDTGPGPIRQENRTGAAPRPY